MLTRRHALIGFLAAAAGCGRKRGSGYPGYAFVANQDGQAIAVVDLTAFAAVTHIHLDAGPTMVVAHPGRRSVYALAAESGQVFEIDASTLKVRRKTGVCRTAHSMRLANGGEALWIACSSPARLVRLDLDSWRLATTCGLESPVADFHVGRDGLQAAVALQNRQGLALVDLTRGQKRVLARGLDLSVARVRSDGRYVLLGDAEARMLRILEISSGRPVVNLPLAVRPDHCCVKSDGGQMFITGAGMDAVVVIYPYNTEVAETVLAGRGPGPMVECTAPDSNLLFVASPAAGEVSVLEIETRRVIGMVGVGREPSCITMTPDQQYALVLNRGSGDVAVIRVAAIAARRVKSAPLFTMIPVGSGPVSVACQGA